MTWNLARAIVLSAAISDENMEYEEYNKVMATIPKCEALADQLTVSVPSELETDCIMELIDKQIYDDLEITIEKLAHIFFHMQLSKKSETILLNKLLTLCGSADAMLSWCERENLIKALHYLIFACDNGAKDKMLLDICLNSLKSTETTVRQYGIVLAGLIAANEIITADENCITVLRMLLVIFLVEDNMYALVSFWGLTQSMLASGLDSEEVIKLCITAMNMEPTFSDNPISLYALLEIILSARSPTDTGLEAVAVLLTHRAWVSNSMFAKKYDEDNAWDDFTRQCRNAPIQVQRILAGSLAGAAADPQNDKSVLMKLVLCVNEDIRGASLRALQTTTNTTDAAYNLLKDVIEEACELP